MKNLFLLLFAIVTFNSCCDNNPCEKQIVINSNLYNNGTSHDFTITDVMIMDDCLELVINSSGCDGNSWKIKLVDAGEILESAPPQRKTRILFTNTELCDAVISKVVSYNIKPIRVTGTNEIYLNLEGWEDQILYQY